MSADRPSWTEDEREHVKDMLRLDYTCAHIGRTFDPPFTRNAIIGRVCRDPELAVCRPALSESARNKLRKFIDDRQQDQVDAKKPAKPEKAIQPLKPRKARAPDPLLIQRKIDAAAEPIEQPLPPLREVPVIGMRMVPLVQLDRGECRWPVADAPEVVGKQLFCGKVAIGGSYCARHTRLAMPVRQAAAILAGKPAKNRLLDKFGGVP